MKLIVGLGNPGKEYEKTRHNIGFMFIDYYLNYKKIDVNWKKKFNGLSFITDINGEKTLFLKPTTFMNLSGESVIKYINYYDIDINDMIVVCDDLDLKVGSFKFKAKGSSGGHNGLKNIEANIGTNNFKRIKIGIDNNKTIDTKDYVLDKISKADMEVIEEVFLKCSEGLDSTYENNFEKVMSLFNQKNK